MINIGILISAILTITLSLSLLFNKVTSKFVKLTYIYTLLFFFLFISLIIYQLDLVNLIKGNNQSNRETVEKRTEKIQLPAQNIIKKKHVKASIMEEILLDVPVVKQYPELPRGCEVTSLSMLLQYAGISIDKMELAQNVKKDTTPFKKIDGIIYYGDPNNGFIGDMYNLENRGYGVYHKPIADLAKKYLPEQIVDLTGTNFIDLKGYLSKGVPIWVITNVTYKDLPNSFFQTWQTPNGPVEITYKEHSVLITGYDSNFVYFNDPITGTKNRRAKKEDFIKAWIQMGSQAITYNPKNTNLIDQ